MGKNEANRVRARVEEKAAGNNLLIMARNIASAALNTCCVRYLDWIIFLAVSAPFFRERCASFSTGAQLFFSLCSFALRDVPLRRGSCFWLTQPHDDLYPRVPVTSQRRRFLVRAAFFAAIDRERAERCLATRFACLDSACLDAERRLSRLSARFVARERFREGFFPRPARPLVRSRLA